uniref:Uncharacterized protein n=1 Tax=Acrobeloides nanus TaxID=290746 RepID=A0A914CLW7_9BILA
KIFLNHDDSDFVLYGLTQDCQLFFARADQLHLLNQLRVQPRVTYCLPELVQLHWRELHTSESIGLELIFKRASHQICALPLEFPSKHALAGNVLFSYSISSAMNYARCSYITNTSFVMEPDLSFMDSTFGDVIYFVDPQSTGSFWTIRQFKLDRDGLRHSLETFIVKNYAESLLFLAIYI